jgi:hypothetical protein
MSANPTVLVLGRRRTDNMPSLTRMLEILKPAPVPGMDASVSSSVRITGVTEPRMGNTCWVCGAPISSGTVCSDCNKGPGIASTDVTCPAMGGCPMGGACVADPIDQAKVDQCPEC